MKLALTILFVGVAQQTSHAFMLPLKGLKPSPLHRLLHKGVRSVRDDTPTPTPTFTTTTESTARPFFAASDEAPAVVDTHWTQGDPIALLRSGEIPAFAWPTTTPTGDLPPVDKALLAKARESPLLKSVAGIWDVLAELCGPHPMLVDPSHVLPGPTNNKDSLALNFAQARALIRQLAAGLHALGFRKGDHVAFFSENSARWLLTEQACALNGCPTAVRGAAAPLDELAYIYEHSDSKAVVLQDVALLKKLHGAGWLSSIHGAPRLVVIVRPEGEDLAAVAAELGLGKDVSVVSVEDVLGIGAKQLPHYRPPEVLPNDLHTLVYTSGTTGRPKGVMLTNKNILHQIKHISLDDSNRLNPGPGDVVLSLLPCWHIFERSSELFALARGASLVYSSVRNFKGDLQTYRPHFLIVVPRLLENVHKSIKDKFAAQPKTKKSLVAVLSAVCLLYNKARKRAQGLVVRRRFPHNPVARAVAVLATVLLWPPAKLADLIVWRKVRVALGGRQKLCISGGSALAKYLENFFEAAGIPVVSGYGLTETSPVIAVRRADRNLVDGGVVGLPPAEVELAIRDLETNEPVRDGKPGVVYTRGPQVMQGYYKDPVATAKAIDANGWFDTGDLGFLNQNSGDLVLTGRAKDVIVLSNGENVEPQPIEDAVLERCPLVDQVMVVGQDQKHLGALVVINPRECADRGLLSLAEAERLEGLVGASAVLLGCKADSAALAAEAALLNGNKALVEAVGREVVAALTVEPEEFRAWEQIKGVHVLLEPFNVPSGLLTQTLKLKRLSVLERYERAIAGLYD